MDKQTKQPIAKGFTATDFILEQIANLLLSMRVARKHIEITPDDETEYKDLKALYVGGEGDLVIEDITGEEVTYENVSGVFLFEAKKIKEATTATNIIGWYY